MHPFLYREYAVWSGLVTIPTLSQPTAILPKHPQALSYILIPRASTPPSQKEELFPPSYPSPPPLLPKHPSMLAPYQPCPYYTNRATATTPSPSYPEYASVSTYIDLASSQSKAHSHYQKENNKYVRKEGRTSW